MKYAFLLLFVVLGSFTMQAQQKRDTVHTVASKKSKMKDKLELNKKQEADIKASRKEFKAEKEKVKNDSKLTDAQKKEKIKSLKEEKKKKVDATLTPEQRVKKKALKKEEKEKKKDKKTKQ